MRNSPVDPFTRSIATPLSSLPTIRILSLLLVSILFSDVGKSFAEAKISDSDSIDSSPATPSPQDPPPPSKDARSATRAPDENSQGEPLRAFEEEVEVTARRRKENIQEIPLSITAFDDQALKERSIRDLSDLSELTANMDFSITGGFGDQTSDAVVVIRGVGQIDTALFSDSGVGIYVDGVYVSRAQGGVLDLLEVDRVEVLRGPQGTLYGKNTNGGAIQVITKKPGSQSKTRIGLTTGRFNRMDGRLSADLPVSSSLSSSIALMSTNRDGWSRSVLTGQDFYDDNRDLGRFALGWRPSNSFSAHFTGDYTRERESGGSQLLIAARETSLLTFYNQVLTDQGLTPYTQELWGSVDFSRSFSPLIGFMDRDTWGTHLDLQWSFGDLSLNSISAYRAFEIESLSDGDGSPNLVADRALEQEHYQLSQELQLSGSNPDSGHHWVIGLLYFSERPQEVNRQRLLADLFPALEAAPGPIYAPPGASNFLCNPGPPPPMFPCFGGSGNLSNFAFFSGPGAQEHIDLKTDSWAIFGEGTLALSDRLSLTLGARWTEDDKEFEYLAFSGLGVQTSDLFNQDSWSDWSGRASLSFQARPNLNLFSTLSRGFKSGGFNGRPQQRQALDPFDPETVLSWELGIKSDWLSRRLRLNGTAFFSDYENIHFAASVEVGGMPVFITQNAGDAEIFGFELELQAYPTPTVQITASVGHLDSEIVTLDPRVPPDSVSLGNVLPKAPAWTFALGVQNSRELANRAVLISRLDYTSREKTYPDFANTEAVAQPHYGLLNARLAYAPPSNRWDVAVFGTNLTNEQYLEAGFSTGAFGLDLGIPGRPREWGIEATFNF